MMITTVFINCNIKHFVLSLWLVGHILLCNSSWALETPSITSSTSTTTTIDLSWSAPSSLNFNSFLVVYRGQNIDLAEQNATVATSVTFVSLSGLVPGETYSVTVAAVNGTNMAISTTRAVTTKLNQPSVTSTQAVNTTSLIVVWTSPPSDYIQAYSVNYRGQNLDTKPQSITVNTPVTTDVYVNGLTPGETYVISVTAISGSVNNTSYEQSVTTHLNRPYTVSFISSNDTITVTWALPSDYVEHYKITAIGQHVDVAVREIIVPGTALSGIIESLASGESYSIFVTAMSGSQTAQSAAVLKSTVPNAPTITSTTSTQNTLTITWTSPSLDYIEQYKINYNGTYIDIISRNITVNSPTMTATITGLSSGETYLITVVAMSSMESAISGEQRKTTKLAKPIITLASITTTTLTVFWTQQLNTHVDTLKVDYLGQNIDTQPRNMSVMGSETIVVIRKLHPGETYVVVATAISGVEMAYSEEIIATTYLNSPTITALTPTNTTMLIQWTSPVSDYIESYAITYSGNTGSITVDGHARELVLHELTPGQSYTVTVVAISGTQQMPSTGKTTTTFPNKPIITTVTRLSTSAININWQSPPQDIVTSYELHYTGKNVDLTRREMVVPSNVKGYNLTGLRAGETYNLTVTAHVVGDVEDRRTASDAVLETTALNAPVINLITSTSTTMRIVWSSTPQDFVEYYSIHLMDENFNATKPNDTVVNGSQNVVTITGLTPGKLYLVAVIANSGSVFAKSAIRLQDLNPESVQLREKGSTKQSITVEWDPPAGVVDYYSVICVHGTPSQDRINYTTGITTASCTGLSQPGNDYSISVISHSWDKTSDASVKVITALPEGVNLTESTSTTSSVQALWAGPSGAADEFIITCDPANEATPQPSRIPFVPSASQYSASCINLAGPGKIYTMTVMTVSGLKNSQSSTISLTAVPEAVTGLAVAELHTTTVTFSWQKDTSCSNCAYDSFLATYVPDSPDTPIQIPELANEDHYVTSFEGLTPGKLYEFQVKSERNGKISRSVSLEQRTIPAKAHITSNPTIANSSILLHWSHAEGQRDRYHVTTSPDEGAVSLINNPVNPSAYITMLTPGKHYNISIVTIIADMESEPAIYSFITQSYTPGPVSNIDVRIKDIYSVQVSFNPPDQPNGEIESYSIKFSGVALGRREHIGTFSSGNNLFAQIGGLNPGFNYIFTVFAVNDYGPGEQSQSQSLFLPVHPPAIPLTADGSRAFIPGAADGAEDNTVIATTKTITVVLEEDIYVHDNGQLLYYTIIVAEETGVDTYQPSTGTTADLLPSWMDVKTANPTPPYQAFERRTYPFLPSDSISNRKKRSTSTSVNIVIGNESCAGVIGYCNGALNPDTSYVFHFRVFNAAGYADTAFSEPIKTDRESMLALALGLSICFTLVLLGIAVVAFLLFLRRRKTRYSGSVRGMGNENKGFEVEVPALNNQALSIKKKQTSRPVRLSDFVNHYSSMKADSEYLFSEEYEELRNVGRGQPVDAAILTANRSKNRFANIQPYDHTRVKLTPIDDEEGSDYVNANYMPGYNSPREFIACQGPLPGTEEDFWRMIWEQRVQNIVMVTQLVEKGRMKCHKYWPDEDKPVYYGDIQVVLNSVYELKNWTVREFTLQMGGKIRSIEHFNFTSWPDHGVPETAETLLSFVKTVRNQIPNNSTPTVVHCSAGVGRTGTFIALDRIMRHLKQHDYVDIYGIVAEMRMHRNHMVQTEQQYVFIHECVIDLLQGGEPITNGNHVNNKEDMDEHFF